MPHTLPLRRYDNVRPGLQSAESAANRRVPLVTRSPGSTWSHCRRALSPVLLATLGISLLLSTGTIVGSDLGRNGVAPPEIGVVVKTESASAWMGSKKQAQFPRGEVLVVVEVQPDWIGVWGFQQSRAIRGWIRRQDVAKHQSNRK